MKKWNIIRIINWKLEMKCNTRANKLLEHLIEGWDRRLSKILSRVLINSTLNSKMMLLIKNVYSISTLIISFYLYFFLFFFNGFCHKMCYLVARAKGGSNLTKNDKNWHEGGCVAKKVMMSLIEVFFNVHLFCMRQFFSLTFLYYHVW